MSLTSTPEEVFYHYILPKINANDTIRLRRVCKTIKPFADAYLRIHYLTQEREINDTDHSFAEFIRRDLPSGKLFLNNRDTSIFEQPEVATFLKKYGDQITNLRVNYFGACVSPAEKKFYFSLKNLQHLELHYTDSSEQCFIHIPPSFQNLKTLILHDMKSGNEFFYYDLVNVCKKLEHLKHPRFLNQTQDFGVDKLGAYYCVKMEIKNRSIANPEYKSPLRVYDLENHFEGETWNPEHVLGLYLLMKSAEEHGFYLANVDSQLLDQPVVDDMDSLAMTLISVRNLSGFLFQRELPLLEVLKVTSFKKVEFCLTIWKLEDGNGEQVKWPSLRELDLNIDSDTTMEYAAREPGKPTKEFLQFLFESTKRPNLTTLKLAFDKDNACKPQTKLACPKALKVVENCENLKVLHISNWQGTNKALSQLWAGLEKLEEVTLDRCQMLGNVAFVGENVEEPTFLRLKNLRRFSLLGLDLMPKITDTVFQLVFKHLKISQFYISSDKPITSVTVNGIRALTKGSFQNSVEKFPFAGWSLKNVTEEEWKELKMEFRATYMV